MAGDFYVTADGSSQGDGSEAKPWDLGTALGHPTAVKPGATIWLRAGTYFGGFTSNLEGTNGAPITVRALPGERVTLDGSSAAFTLIVRGNWTHFWGLEVARGGTNVNVGPSNAPSVGHKLINLVVHDSRGQGVGHWKNAVNAEIYGSMFYYNGTNTNLDHDIYTQNDSNQAKRIIDNVMLNSCGWGLHAYGSGASKVRNFHIEGNAFQNNGSLCQSGSSILVGGQAETTNIALVDNYVYARPVGTNVTLAFDATKVDRYGLKLTGNYLARGRPVLRMQGWAADVQVQENRLVGDGVDHLVYYQPPAAHAAYAWNGNAYFQDGAHDAFWDQGASRNLDGWQKSTGFDAAGTLTVSRPTGVQVFVRPNQYEAGRAHVIVYNWDASPTVSVDLSGILTLGTPYIVRNAQDYYGPLAASGTYSGGKITLPMTGLTVATPANFGIDGAVHMPTSTGPVFNTFVIEPSCSF